MGSDVNGTDVGTVPSGQRQRSRIHVERASLPDLPPRLHRPTHMFARRPRSAHRSVAGQARRGAGSDMIHLLLIILLIVIIGAVVVGVTRR